MFRVLCCLLEVVCLGAGWGKSVWGEDIIVLKTQSDFCHVDLRSCKTKVKLFCCLVLVDYQSVVQSFVEVFPYHS